MAGETLQPAANSRRLVPIGYPNPRGLAVKAGESQNDAPTREPACLQGISALSGDHICCLPCRRSRVRIPSAALSDQALQSSVALLAAVLRGGCWPGAHWVPKPARLE